MISIRPANENDVPALVSLNYGLFQEDAGQRDRTVNLEWPAEYGEAYFRDFIAQNGRRCWLAEADGEAVGYLVGYVERATDYHLVSRADLVSMFVRPSFRGQGIGTDLAMAFIAWAQAQGAKAVTVTAYYANERAVKFYQALGFRPSKLTLVYPAPPINNSPIHQFTN